jgi:hypothetical protein
MDRETPPPEWGFSGDKPAQANYLPGMSFKEVLAELPLLTVSQRQLLVRRALELDERGLAGEDEVVVEQRLADHRRDPKSAVPLEVMEKRLRSRFAK